MKWLVSLLFLLIINSSFSQTVNVSGRCYYDINRNHVFDGGDSVLANVYVYADFVSGSFNALANSAGQYNMSLPLGTYNITTPGRIDVENYDMIAENYRTYTVAGSDVVDLAFQPRDSIVRINASIVENGQGSLPPTGGNRSYTLTYGYDGWLPTLPATLTLRYNPMLSLQTVSVPPSVSAPGLLQWNFASLPRNVLFTQGLDAIDLSFDFPPVGDTIALFSLVPKLVSNILVSKKPTTEYYNYTQTIEHPDPQPIGTTSGAKWLRQYPTFGEGAYEEAMSIDTTQDGNGYFMVGHRSTGFSITPSLFYVYVAKLNKDGLSVWEHNLQYLPNHLRLSDATAIKHTSDGGCLVLGTAFDTSITTAPNYYKVVVVRFDAMGNLQWVKKLQSSGDQSTGKDIVTLPDGSFWIVGSTNAHDGDFAHNNADTVYNNIFVAKLAANGNLLFTKVYGGSNYEYGERLIPLQNGSFLVLGITASNNGDVVGAHPHYVVNPYQYYLSSNYTDTVRTEEAWVLNINASGGIIWSRCYGGTVNSYISGAAENGSGIMLVGTTDSKDGDLPYYPEVSVPLWVLQVSPSNGNIIWSKLHKFYKGYPDSNYASYGEAYYDNYVATNLLKTKDGNFVLGSASSDKYGTVKAKHGYADVNIIKLNNIGDILWQKAIGGNGYEYPYEIIVDKNDDILFAGTSNSENDDLYLHTAQGSFTSFFSNMMVGKLGITNIIKGQVFVDNNGNHSKDANEPYYSQGQVISVKGSDTLRARIFNGQYLINADTGTYITRYQPANNYYTLFPASRTVNFTSFDLKDSADFALTPIPGIKDLEIQLVPLSTPRPGFDVTYRIITKNVGTSTVNNAVVGLKHDTRMAYNFASRTEDGATADSLWWGPFTLNAFDIDTLFVNFTLDPPPLLNNNDTLMHVATANPVTGDSSVANNKAVLREVVRGSFDPNDKTEAHGGTLTTTQYAGGEYLQYLVRFQNTGTDTAFFITVKDTLQQNLDLTTLEVLSASHPFVFTLQDQVATWDFKKILLPDSTTDEPASHGFILFRIKPKSGLTVGDAFSNKAAIYFDYNLPVITNEDKTILGANNGVCPNGNVSYTSGLSGSTYQWQVNTGSGYVNLANGGIYSDVTTPVLRLTGVSTALTGNRYRCVVNGNQYSPENLLRFAVQWTGNANTAWENPANWDCGTLPDGKTEVVIPAGTNYPQVGSNAACFSLRLSPGSTVTVKTGFQLTITGRPE